MDKELMDKEVLCILDTRQIQRLLFRANTMLDSIGASDLIIHILDDAIRFSLCHIDTPLDESEYDLSVDADADIRYFSDSRIRFQLLSCAAGNAMFIARTGSLAQKIIRKISRYYLENGYELNLAAAAVEKTHNFGYDLSQLYLHLDRAKASSDLLTPMGALPVCMREHTTGNPVTAYDVNLGDPVSTSSIIRRKEAGKRKILFRIEDISTTKAFDEKKYRAFIHADGNNVGITISRILQRTPDYAEGIRMRRRVNQRIQSMMAATVERTLQNLKTYYRSWCRTEGCPDDKEDFGSEFQIIHSAGDDLNCICNARWAFPFLRFFFENLKGAYIWKDQMLEVPLYACAGVAFITEDSTYHSAFSMAEECCSSAKKAAKKEENLRGGLAGNWVDFQVLDAPNTQDLEMLREQSYQTKEQVSLLVRPYCLDPEAEDLPISYKRLMQQVRIIKNLRLDRVQQTIFRHSYMGGKEEFQQFLRFLKKQGTDLRQLLGAPIFTDGEKQQHAAWFDAAELSDFILYFPGDDESCTE